MSRITELGDRLSKIRKAHDSPFWKTALFCVMLLISGAGLGAASKLADVYSEMLGSITSGICLWIFLGTLICMIAKNPFRSAAYVFLFCGGMIVAYYLTAELNGLYYSRTFVSGWSVFTLFTPLFALAAWYARGKSRISWVIRIGIVVVMLIGSFTAFPGNLFFDALFAAGTFAVTLVKEKDK